jgi:mercuric ion binding protein
MNMKSIQFFAVCLFLFTGFQSTQAQTKQGGTQSVVKSATFKVWGNCGMCKKNIEGAAKKSGATYANWNVDTKMVTVKYATTKTSVDKIQKGIAGAGYDNEKYTGSDDAYSNLDECCQYDRKTAVSTEAKACCVKDGKCTGDKACCKKMEGKADCCANGTCAKEGGCCANMKCEKDGDCCKKEGTGMVAMKEASCEKGADCCKKTN